MAKFWCITCKDEVEHQANYCHSRCGNDCEEVCSICKKSTLTNALNDCNPHDTDIAVLRWATGKAQQEMKRTNNAGEIMISVDSYANGIRYSRIAYYNAGSVLAEFRG